MSREASGCRSALIGVGVDVSRIAVGEHWFVSPGNLLLGVAVALLALVLSRDDRVGVLSLSGLEPLELTGRAGWNRASSYLLEKDKKSFERPESVSNNLHQT